MVPDGAINRFALVALVRSRYEALLRNANLEAPLPVCTHFLHFVRTRTQPARRTSLNILFDSDSNLHSIHATGMQSQSCTWGKGLQHHCSGTVHVKFLARFEVAAFSISQRKAPTMRSIGGGGANGSDVFSIALDQGLRLRSQFAFDCDPH